MASLRLSLTDRLCASAQPGAQEYSLLDQRQRRLALRIQPGGTKAWIVRLREDGKSIRHTLGTFPEIRVKDARKIASALLADGVALPPSRPTSPLFELFQAEHEGRCASRYKPAGLRTYQTYVRAELLPAFAGKRLETIDRQDIVRWFERYSARAPGGANRALGILRQMLGQAKDWGYLPDTWRNPASGVRTNARRPVGTFLSEEQMQRLGGILESRIEEGCMGSSLLRFLALTGCRVSEAVNLEWRDVQPDRLHLRDTKTGPRDVLLGLPVRRFLKSHRAALPKSAQSVSAPVFPLAAGQNYEAVRSVWAVVRRTAALPPTLRIHDLRHSFASHAVMSGETLFSTSRLLGHSHIRMTARYAHLADHSLLSASERIGQLILKSAGASQKKS